MAIYAFYIFDRHAECIYTRRWTGPAAASGANSRPSSSQSSKPGASSAATLASRPNSQQITNGEPSASGRRQLNKDTDNAKLVFGVVFSLRNMVRRLGGDDDEFISYRTGEYRLHYYETPTSLKFVMLTDPKTSNNMRVILHQIWANLYVEYVVRNPVSPVEHPGGVGVNNELFELGLERFVQSIFQPQT